MTSFGKSMTLIAPARPLVLLLAIIHPLSRDGPNSSDFPGRFERFCRAICMDRTSRYRKAITKTALRSSAQLMLCANSRWGEVRKSVHSVTVHRQWRRRVGVRCPAVGVTSRGYCHDEAQHHRRLCVVVPVTGLSPIRYEEPKATIHP